MKTFPVTTSGFKDSLFLVGFFASEKNLEKFNFTKNGLKDTEAQRKILELYSMFKKSHTESTIENIEKFFDVNLIFVSKCEKNEELEFLLKIRRLPSKWNNPHVFRQYKGKLLHN